MWERARARVRARGCAEFASLGASEARRRIGLGLSVLRAHDLDPVGFVPPGWLARPSTADVLADLGFRYTLTQWRVLDLSRRTSPIVPSTSQRPGSVVTGASARVNGVWVQGWAAMRRPLRIALHPDDLADDRLVTATERMFSHASKQRYEGITYSEFVDRGDASRRAGGE
jgi:predicted deacetylase